MAITIFAFVKIFEKEEYARKFLSGELYMNPIGYFQKYTDSDGELRGDPWEGIVACYQAGDVNVQIGDMQIRSEEIVGQIVFQGNEILNCSAFCIYSLNSTGFDKVSADTLDQFKKVLEIHRNNYGLGSYCVVVNRANEFLGRIETGIRKAQVKGRGGLVEYFDENTKSGKFEEMKLGFHKREMFSHQREYRIVLDAGVEHPEPYILDIGDLSDIAEMLTPEEFNRTLKIGLPDGSAA
jgi:hypothetical protein